MSSTETLTSLAMLKVNIDQRRDYLDYLRPFVLQVLLDHRPAPVTDQVVHDLIMTDFGLEVPPRTLQIVIQRLSRSEPIRREDGVYHITGALTNAGLASRKTAAVRHIDAVLSGLTEFATQAGHPFASPDDAVKAVCGFLSEFNVSYIRAFLRGTAIPTIAGHRKSYNVLIGDYVMHLQKNDIERFDSFSVLVQGHMLANALLCPDLQHAPKSYKDVTFFFDTPILVQKLGLEGGAKRRAVEDLHALIEKLGGRMATFSHTRDEVGIVIRGAADHIDARNGRGAIVMEARRNGTTRSDLILLDQLAVTLFEKAGIKSEDTPRYIADFQIDEAQFERLLEDEVSYFNPRARDFDINSVRSIYVLRSNTAPQLIEKCKAVFVTCNTAFSRAAYEYGKMHGEACEVSSVITDFSLANMAWLKAPVGAPTIPMTELLAYSYAAVQPSPVLMEKFLVEVEKLERQGIITARDHQLLRSSTITSEELVRLTLGDEEALTEETITETLRRVTNEIKREENAVLIDERNAHLQTQDALRDAREQRDRLKERLYWKSRSKARIVAWVVSIVVGLLLVVGSAVGIGLTSKDKWVGLFLTFATISTIVWGLASFFFGTTVRRLHDKIESRTLSYFLRRESKLTGLDFSSSQ